MADDTVHSTDGPLRLFEDWFQHAVSSSVPEPEAMAVATSSPDGRPSVRMVLLKGFDEHGFVFYTNYESRKGRELEENSRAAAVLHWVQLHRQIRIEGEVERVSPQESDAYFHSRPRGSRLSAAVSRQSRPIPDRQTLERQVRELAERLGDADVPRPAYWGGYRIKPEAIEFWQGRPDRLHERLLYVRQAGAWLTQRLSP